MNILLNIMNKSSLRIIQDFHDFENNKPKDIYLHINKKNFYQSYAMIIGPKNTPYFGGYFLFDIKFPKNYPHNPPSVKFLTINNKVRFNPNLYEKGKVCLSILGTWSGPSWTPIMNLRLVLLSIQSLLGEYPLTNEPGFENIKPNDIKSMYYNYFLIYNTYKLAIINILNKKYKKYSNYFKKEIEESFKQNYIQLYSDLKSYQITIGDTKMRKQVYFMPVSTFLNFSSLLEDFTKIKIDFK